jgi:hypothetical protein
MASPLVYLDTSDVAEGSLPQLKDAIAELAGFVEAHEPELLAYQVYFSDDGKRMSILHVHRDARSLDFHMEVAGPKFAKFGDLLALRSITTFGAPSPRALAALEQKARDLGGARVTVEQLHAGFARFG